MVKMLPESVRSAPERVIFDPLSSTCTKSRRVLILLLLSVMSGFDVVLVKVDPSRTLTNRFTVNVPLVSLRSGPARSTIPERITLRKLFVAVRVLGFKVTRGSELVLLRVELSATNMNENKSVMLGSPMSKVEFVAFKSGPAKVRVDPEPVELDKLTKFRSASTVLPLSVIRGLVVVLVKVEPSTTSKNLSAIVKVLPESLTSGPAKVTVAGPVTVIALSSTRKKLSGGSLPFD